MNRLEFMKELARLLDDLPREEKIEILKYYNGYFDDAGEENEAAIIEELGSPAQVAASVKAGMDESTADHVEFTEKGVDDGKTVHEYREKHTSEERPGRDAEGWDAERRNAKGWDAEERDEKRGKEENYRMQRRERNGWKAVAIICLVILTFPFWIGALAVALGLGIGLLAVLFGVALAAGISLVAFIACGLVSLVWGIAKLFVVPLSGAMSISVGIMLLGAGLLVFLLILLVAGKLIPLLFRAIGNLFRWLGDRLHRRERA